MPEQNSSQDPEKPTLDDLGKRLDAAQKTAHEERTWKKPGEDAPRSGLGLAFRVGIELVSAVAVGAGAGWLVDEWLGTRPWAMLVMFLFGGAAGVLNVYRMASGHGHTVGYQHARDTTNASATTNASDESAETDLVGETEK